MRRLHSLLACLLLPIFGLAACTQPNSQVTLDAAKLQMNLVINGTVAAANVYLVGTSPAPSAANVAVVKAGIQTLMAAQNTLNSITVAADWRSAASQAITDAQGLSPLVAPFLGPYAQYMPFALAMVNAFIQSSAPPATAAAAPTPPATMTVPAAVVAAPAGPAPAAAALPVPPVAPAK